MTIEDDISRIAADLEPRVIGWRRQIHANPELAFEERETAALVTSHLRSLGYEVSTGIAETGVIGTIRPEQASSRGSVALRADMDALPVEEKTGLSFSSSKRVRWCGQDVPVMHACGHDAHVAILMGVASLVAELREKLDRPVRLIFQPAEEIIPEGRNGAERMVEEEVLDGVEELYGLHVTQSLPAGVVGLRPGPIMASVDELVVEIIGKQTHGAYPWKGVDPIVVAAQVILALQTIPSRQTDLTASPAVITIGRIEGGIRSNIIPERVRLEGTIRTLDESVRREVHSAIRRTVSSIVAASAAESEVGIRTGYPVTVNDSERVERCRRRFRVALSDDEVVDVPAVFGGEDVSFFLQKVPGSFFFLGVRPREVPLSEAIPNHSPQFDLDETSLIAGVRALSSLVFE